MRYEIIEEGAEEYGPELLFFIRLVSKIKVPSNPNHPPRTIYLGLELRIRRNKELGGNRCALIFIPPIIYN